MAGLTGNVSKRQKGYERQHQIHFRNIPGKLSETVYGTRFAEANATAWAPKWTCSTKLLQLICKPSGKNPVG